MNILTTILKCVIGGVAAGMFVMIWAAIINMSHALGQIADILDEVLKGNDDKRGDEG